MTARILRRWASIGVPLVLTLFWLVDRSAAQEQREEDEDQEQTASEDAGSSRRRIPFPILIRDPTNGTGLGAGLLLLYRLNEQSLQDSQTEVFGYFTDTHSWQLGVGQSFSFKEDHYRSKITGRFGNVNHRFNYQALPRDVVYGEPMNTVTASLSYNFVGRLYGGLNYRFIESDYVFDKGSEEEQEFSKTVLDGAGAEKATGSGLGLIVGLDSRNNQYAPTQGYYTDLQYFAFRGWIGSDNDYTAIEAFFNYYWKVGRSEVLAFRFRWRDAHGDIPFNGESTYGAVDLRGFATGKYRGDGMLAGQAEYRFPVWKRVSAVVFGGTGRVYGDPETLGSGTTLSSGGAGVRFLFLKERGTNIGLDWAIGTDDNWGLYFRFGEAF